jgi:Uma2 family endonuclease
MLVEIEPPYLLIRPVSGEEEFYALAGEDRGWEFLDGKLVMSPASERHEDLFGFLGTLLRGFLDSRGGGVVRGSRYPMRLDERWSPEPDLLVVRRERRHLLTSKFLDGPADFVIEIASEADPRFEEREKLPRYEEAGIPEIWLVKPVDRVVAVRSRSGDAYEETLHRSGRLASRQVPGFWIDADWLWQEELPSSLGCLQRILG